MSTVVLVTDPFVAWYDSLTADQQFAVKRVVGLLEEYGPALPYPYSSSILGVSFALRELRIQYEGEPFRVLYAFDPSRQAVLLVGGSKAGLGKRWYTSAIREAEKLWKQYLSSAS